VRYRFPFDPSVPRQLGQGVGGDMGYDLYGNAVSSPQGDPASHVGPRKYGFDWGMPKGTKVVAARDGEVARVVDGFTVSGPQQSLATQTNAVFIKHDDGTWSEYTGLDVEIPVKPGQKVQAGEVIGACGATGSWRGGIGVHFAVGRLDEEGNPETVDIRFDDGSAAGFVPVPGSYYGAPGGKASRVEAPPGEAEAATP
jgi:murein DD-endopeptidase MepM/ murein hydrolase activator NlpD